MSKKKSQAVEEESTKTSKVQLFFFVFLIPAIFTLVIMYIILIVAGVDVNKKIGEIAQNTPILNKVVDNKGESAAQLPGAEQQKEMDRLKKTLDKQNKKMTEVQQASDQKDTTIQQLKAQIEKLQQEKEDVAKAGQKSSADDQKLLSTFQDITPKKAALIFAQLDQQQALTLMKKLDSTQLASILEKMDPAVAAKYVNLLASSTS